MRYDNAGGLMYELIIGALKMGCQEGRLSFTINAALALQFSSDAFLVV